MSEDVYIIGYESLSSLGLNVSKQFSNLLKQKVGYSKYKKSKSLTLYGELANVKNLLKEKEKRIYQSLMKLGSRGLLHNYLLNVFENLEINFSCNPERIGIFVGTSAGDQEFLGNAKKTRMDNSAHLCQNSLSSFLSRLAGAEGESTTISQACTSGMASLIAASRAIKLGEIDVAIVAGVDGGFKSYNTNSKNNQALSKKNFINSFDKSRDGTVVSGGCGIIILANSKLSKNLKKYGKVLGYSLENKSGKVENPANGATKEGYVSTIKKALKDSKIKSPSFVSAHATGTYLNDLVEMEAINELVPKSPVISLKKFIGHGAGASSIIEISLGLKMMERGLVSGMGKVNFEKGKKLNLIEKNEKMKIKNFLVDSAGFNGAYGSVLIGRAD